MMNHPDPHATHYQLPEAAEQRLRQLHEQLILLSRLSAASTAEENGHLLQLSRNALADCFEELAGRLGETLQMIHWPLPDELPSGGLAGSRRFAPTPR